jgi:hypothetical protein
MYENIYSYRILAYVYINIYENTYSYFIHMYLVLTDDDVEIMKKSRDLREPRQVCTYQILILILYLYMYIYTY